MWSVWNNTKPLFFIPKSLSLLCWHIFLHLHLLGFSYAQWHIFCICNPIKRHLYRMFLGETQLWICVCWLLLSNTQMQKETCLCVPGGGYAICVLTISDSWLIKHHVDRIAWRASITPASFWINKVWVCSWQLKLLWI